MSLSWCAGAIGVTWTSTCRWWRRGWVDELAPETTWAEVMAGTFWPWSLIFIPIPVTWKFPVVTDWRFRTPNNLPQGRDGICCHHWHSCSLMLRPWSISGSSSSRASPFGNCSGLDTIRTVKRSCSIGITWQYWQLPQQFSPTGRNVTFPESQSGSWIASPAAPSNPSTQRWGLVGTGRGWEGAEISHEFGMTSVLQKMCVVSLLCFDFLYIINYNIHVPIFS